MRRRDWAVVAALTLLLGLLPIVAPDGTPAAAARPSVATVDPVAKASTPRAAARSKSKWRARPEQYPAVATRTDVPIKVSDGTVLRGDLRLPARANGTAVPGRWPVIVTITAYNKTVLGSSDRAGSGPSYLVKRGYAHLTVDARGTGSSGGRWCAFCTRENKDGGEIMTWAARQPWSNGRTGMNGPSYMAMAQIFAAAARPPGLKAIFPAVPGADVYRDVVASGGALDMGFIPFWLGLVTATSIVPPAYGATEPAGALGTLLEHATTAGTFTVPLLVGAVLGGKEAVDGPFYKQRSPLNVVKRINVPTFFISGQHDIFQRGTPLLFENLQKRGVPTKLIAGPWDHLQASAGEGLEKAGYGTLAELQLRWFDRWVKGRRDKTLARDIPALTYFEKGANRWSKARRWMRKDLSAASFRLSGRATNGAPGRLTRGAAKAGTSTVLPIPVAGLCSRSTSQWTAGIVGALRVLDPCLQDNRVNDLAGLVFETAPLKRRVRLHGPMNARIHTSTAAGDGMLSVAVSSVAPNGKVTRLTGGWQVLSHRAVNRKRTRRLDGKIIQVHHPFTRKRIRRLAPGQVAPIDVEIFPTHARIKPGHRLRVAIQAFDVPHLVPPLPHLLPTLVPMTVHASQKYPSELTVPVIGR